MSIYFEKYIALLDNWTNMSHISEHYKTWDSSFTPVCLLVSKSLHLYCFNWSSVDCTGNHLSERHQFIWDVHKWQSELSFLRVLISRILQISGDSLNFPTCESMSVYYASLGVMLKIMKPANHPYTLQDPPDFLFLRIYTDFAWSWGIKVGVHFSCFMAILSHFDFIIFNMTLRWGFSCFMLESDEPSLFYKICQKG